MVIQFALFNIRSPLTSSIIDCLFFSVVQKKQSEHKKREESSKNEVHTQAWLKNASRINI